MAFSGNDLRNNIFCYPGKHFSHPYSPFSHFLAQKKGLKARCVTHSMVCHPWEMQKIISWTYWGNCEEFHLDWRQCSGRTPSPAFLFGSTKAGTEIWNSGDRFQSHIPTKELPPTRTWQRVVFSLLMAGPGTDLLTACCPSEILSSEDLFLHGDPYLWNRTASLWQQEYQRIETRPFLMDRLSGRVCWAILRFIVVTQMHLGTCVCWK